MELTLSKVFRKEADTQFGKKTKMFIKVEGDEQGLYTCLEGAWNSNFKDGATVNVGNTEKTGEGKDRDGKPVIYYKISAPEETRRKPGFSKPSDVTKEMFEALVKRVEDIEKELSEFVRYGE